MTATKLIENGRTGVEQMVALIDMAPCFLEIAFQPVGDPETREEEKSSPTVVVNKVVAHFIKLNNYFFYSGRSLEASTLLQPQPVHERMVFSANSVRKREALPFVFFDLTGST